MAAILFAILAALAWSATLLILRGAVQVWPVGQAGCYSRFIAAAVVFVWVCASRRGWRRLQPRGTVGLLLWMGLVAAFLSICSYAGLQLTTATSASLLIRLDLLFVVLIGWALGVERLTSWGAVAIPVMLVGLALLMEVHHCTWSGRLAGDLLIVLAGLGLAVNAFIIRRILGILDEESVCFYNMLLCSVGFGVLALYQGLAIPSVVVERPSGWWWLIVLGVAAAASTSIYYAALHRMPVWRLRAFLLISPFVVAIAEWALWGTRLTRTQLLGGALLLAGVFVLVLDEARAHRVAGALCSYGSTSTTATGYRVTGPSRPDA
jgi:drug/metabolite transporter (DMT)-like permease